MSTIDVIIPQWNQLEKTSTCLRSIARHAPGVRIVLVDNGSTEDQTVPDKLLRPGDVVIRNSVNVGFVRAVNQGLQAAISARFVVIQNNDTEIFDDVFARMVRVFEREPRYGALGPVTSECGSWQAIDRITQAWGQSRRRKLMRPRLSQGGRRDVELLREVQALRDHAARAQLAADRFGDHVEGLRGMIAFFSVMLTRRAVDTVGLLDTDYGLGFGDDDDYCDRLHAAGFGVGLVPGCYVRHDHRTTFRANFSEGEIERQQRAAMGLLKRKRAERARRGR